MIGWLSRRLETGSIVAVATDFQMVMPEFGVCSLLMNGQPVGCGEERTNEPHQARDTIAPQMRFLYITAFDGAAIAEYAEAFAD